MKLQGFSVREVPPPRQLLRELNASPRTSTLISGENSIFRFPIKADEPLFRQFFDALPDEEVELLREDVRNPATISNWFERLDEGRVLPLAAFNDSEEIIVGISSLHFREGVHRHIAGVRIVVSATHRQLGLGSAMMKELIRLADNIGLFYLHAEILAKNQLAVKAFRQLGFETACTIDSYFLSRSGRAHDVTHMYKRLRASVEEDFFYVF